MSQAPRYLNLSIQALEHWSILEHIRDDHKPAPNPSVKPQKRANQPTLQVHHKTSIKNTLKFLSKPPEPAASMSYMDRRQKYISFFVTEQ